jgi:hypothetical protein
LTTNSPLTPKQTLFLWNLLVLGDDRPVGQLRPTLVVKTERRPLEEAGFIQLEQHGRALHILLTDQAWHWAAQESVPSMMISKFAAPVLEGLLCRLQPLLQQRQIALAELLAPSPPTTTPDIIPDDLPARIRDAYLQLSQGKFMKRVRIADVCQVLSVPATALADTLIMMNRDHTQYKLTCMSLDDPTQLGEQDHRHAIMIGGTPRHLIYLEA